MINDFKKLNPIQKELYRQLYKKSFYEFAKAFWETADPQKFVDGILVQFYCETFQYMARGWVNYDGPENPIPNIPISENVNVIDVRENKHNLCINIPPRHSKSMILNVLAGVWIWLNAPIKLASVSHTRDLAATMNNKRQKILNSEKFKFFFPEIKLTTNTTMSLKEDRGGELYSINRDAMTGYGFDIGICDDLTNAESARKDKEEMNNAWSFFQNTLPSRANDPTNYVILNIQQRLAPMDITGHIMSDSKLSSQYTFVVIPAQFEKLTYLVCPISGTVFEFNPGDYLWPERFGDYQNLRLQVGESVWQTQYLQKPIASDRTVIKDDMIIEKDEVDCPSIEQADTIYASHDFPVKDKESSDYLGSVLGYKVGSTLYIKDGLEKRMAFVKSVEYVKQLDDMFHGIIQIVEDKANGAPILQHLQDSISGLQGFQTGTKSKMQRLESASFYLLAGNVVFIKNKYNQITMEYELSNSLKNLKTKLLSFPFVDHDDIIDAFSQLVLFVFMDRMYMVYGRSFNDMNIINANTIHYDYSNIFFNKDGDIWKIAEIGIQYGVENKLIVLRELMFKSNVTDGLNKLKEFGPDKNVFIDASDNTDLLGVYTNDIVIEKYSDEDFEQSVGKLNLGFANKKILIDSSCKLLKADIDNFKYDKKRDDMTKFKTTKDGFVAFIRSAIKYYGGI